MKNIFLLLVLVSVGSKCWAGKYNSFFDCAIDKSAFDAPTSLVIPTVKIVTDSHGDRLVEVSTDKKEYISLSNDLKLKALPEGYVFVGKNVHVYETSGLERPPKAVVTMTIPHLRYNCQLSQGDKDIYDSLNVAIARTSMPGSGTEIKTIGRLTCIKKTIITAPPAKIYYSCELENN